ncbi:MAG: hypothetical protein JXR65_02335 [Bacteroidales bacterium]|nr:hypothetical protein [Bacteroidales bacterium]
MEISSTQAKVKEWGYTLVISTISGLFAYLLLHLLTGLSVLYFSYDLNIKAVLETKGILFLNTPGNSDWTKDATITVFLVKPILNLLLAVISMIIYTLIKNKSQSFSFFIIWIIVFGLNNMFGTLAENGLMKTGIYNVVEVMNLGTIAFVLVLGISVYFLYISGIGTGKIILLTLANKNKTNNHIHLLYLIIAYLIPWTLIFWLTFSFSDLNIKIAYLFGSIILVSTLRSKGPENEGIHLNPLPGFFWFDVVSTLLFIIGIFFMLQLFSMNIQLH